MGVIQQNQAFVYRAYGRTLTGIGRLTCIPTLMVDYRPEGREKTVLSPQDGSCKSMSGCRCRWCFRACTYQDLGEMYKSKWRWKAGRAAENRWCMSGVGEGGLPEKWKTYRPRG